MNVLTVYAIISVVVWLISLTKSHVSSRVCTQLWMEFFILVDLD